MAVRYSFAGRLVRLELVGTYTLDEILRVFETALSDPAFPQDGRLLLDTTGSTGLATKSEHDVRRGVDLFAARAQHVANRCAVLTSAPATYGLGRMSAVFGERLGLEIAVFKDTDEASAWLGVTTPAG